MNPTDWSVVEEEEEPPVNPHPLAFARGCLVALPFAAAFWTAVWWVLR